MLEKGNKLACMEETCGYVMDKPKDEAAGAKEE